MSEVTAWPTPSGDGSCDVNIEYEVENTDVTLYDLVISIPLPSGSYPTVSSNSVGSWSVNPSYHSIDWSMHQASASDDATRSGTLEFSIAGDEPAAFFPIKVSFVATGSLASVNVRVIEHFPAYLD